MSDGFYSVTVTHGSRPKRGDLMQTAIGTRRERTWFIWFVRSYRRGENPRRFKVLRVRWWEIEPETRIALWRSAELAGGQTVWYQERKERKL